MIARPSGVIKKNQVHEGPAAAVAVGSGAAGAGLPKARLIEQREGLAIVEVVCGCGRTIVLQCEYAS